MFNKILYIYSILVVNSFTIMAESICFYNGEGTGPLSSQSLLESLKQELEGSFYELKNSDQMIDCIHKENDNSRLRIIIPGGNTVIIARSLANSLVEIRQAVNDGASYLGVCAGAMLASSRLYFNGEELLDRNQLLSLFNGYSYSFSHPFISKKIITNDTAMGRLVNIKDYETNNIFKVFWNRGGYFENINHDSTVLSVYVDDPNHDENIKPLKIDSSAILSTRYGKGLVLLSQVHLELACLANFSKYKHEIFYKDHAPYAGIQLENIKTDEVNEYELYSTKLLKQLLRRGNFVLKKL